MGVSGHCNKPGCYEEELGIPWMGKLIEKYAGGVKGGKYKAAFHGGISMGILGTDQYNAELDFDIGKKYNVLGLGTACVTVFNDTTDMIRVARNCVRFFAHESCGQCTPCREEQYSWAHKILNRIVDGRGRPKDLDLLLELALGPRHHARHHHLRPWPMALIRRGSSKTMLQKFPDEFKAAVKSDAVQGVEVTVGGVKV